MDIEFSILDPFSDEDVLLLYNFIQTNYHNSDFFYLDYTLDLFQFFIRKIGECIPLLLSERGSKMPIGCIVGSVRNVVCNGKEFRCLDIDFLCVKKEMRNLRLTEKLIAKLHKEGLKIGCNLAFFTISKEIDIFKTRTSEGNLIGSGGIVCHKKAFHYPILQSKHNQSLLSPKVYRGTLPEEKQIQFLHKSLLQFYKRRFIVYDKKDLNEIMETFNNNSFIHYMFDNGTYFCFYILVLMNEGKRERHLYLYTYKIDTVSPQCIKKYIDEIAKCKETKNFDYISILDPFGFSDRDYSLIGFGRGTGSLYFYLPSSSELKMPKLTQKDISLVPI
jgi:hypothetical protein